MPWHREDLHEKLAARLVDHARRLFDEPRPRADFRRRGENRRADGFVGPGLDRDRPRFGGGGADGGRGFRRQGLGQADHRDFRRSPDQAGHRRRHRQPLVRCRTGRPDRRRAGVGGGTCGAAGRQREEEAVHHAFDRNRRFPRQVLHALRHAMGVRYPCARGRHRAGSGQARRQHLVLPDRRLRVRPFAGARRYAGDRAERRQGARRGAPSVRDARSVLLHSPGPGLEGEDHRHRLGPARQRQCGQARRRVRHFQRRPADGGLVDADHRRQRARPQGGAGAVADHLVLLGHGRQDPRMVEALFRQDQQNADHVAGRRLFVGDALPQRHQGRRHRRPAQGRGQDARDAGRGLLLAQRPTARR